MSDVHKFGELYLPLGTICKFTTLSAPHQEYSGKRVQINAGPMLRNFTEDGKIVQKKAYMTDMLMNGMPIWATRNTLVPVEWPNYIQDYCDEMMLFITRPLSQCSKEILDGLYE
jgi:hypothetical protein